MSRRRRVVLASAAFLFALGALLAGALAVTTSTPWGREQIRSYAEGRLGRAIRGKVHIGRISGSLFSDLVVDSIALRETNDSLFIATGPVRVSFDPRDLLDRRLLVRAALLARPVVHVRQDSLGRWNYRNIFPPGPPRARRTGRAFGDFVVVRNVSLVDAAFHLTMPWRPADSLTGSRRDSAVAFALGRPDKRIRRAGSHFVQTRSWTEGRLEVASARLADPDSTARSLEFTRIDVDEFDPPMRFRNGRGRVRILRDSLWVDVPSFELPGSRGNGSGKVWWGGDRPTRYDLTIHGDTVSLADVAWVYPTLPTAGGGSMTLRIRNQRDLRVIDYALSDMDVVSMRSRLRGAMTFGVGAEVLEVKGVDMTATPIDWVLIERLSGEPLPLPWKGAITARVRASGGPVNAFRIEQGEFTFADANVPGATSRGRGQGEIDMLFPAFTKFHGLDVELEHLDLATLQFLDPEFPRLDGAISGRATLDSLWLDVRFRSADITHRFEGRPASRITGSGRATIGDTLITWDVALTADSVNLTTIAAAWPELELEQRGAMAGPVRAQGTAADLALSTELRGASGDYAFDGRVDIDSVGGYGFNGSLRFANADLRALYDTAAFPVTSLAGTADLAITGDSVENYVGSVDLQLARSVVDSVRLRSGARARLLFDDGLLRVDTLHAETALGTLGAQGDLGLRADRAGNLRTWLAADSLGGLRPWLVAAAADDSVARLAAEADSLTGRADLAATLRGSVDALRVEARLDGAGVVAGSTRAERLTARADLSDVTGPGIRGTISVEVDSATAATVEVARIALDATVLGRDSSRITLRGELADGPNTDITAALGIRGDTIRVRPEAFRLGVLGNEWVMGRPATVTVSAAGWQVDSLVLRGRGRERVALNGSVPIHGPVLLGLRVDSLPLDQLASIAQSRLDLAGTATLAVDVGGTSSAPVMDMRGALEGTSVGEVRLSRTTLAGHYENRRVTGRMAVVRNDTTILDVVSDLPVDLAFDTRWRVLDDTMRVTFRSRDVDLGIVESFTPSVTQARGRLNADVALAGRTSSATVQGFFRVDQGAMRIPTVGLALRDINVDIAASRDTARIRRFRLTSGASASDSLGLSGWVARGREDEMAFDLGLQANNFEAVNSRRIGRLSVSSDVRLTGSTDASVLGGNILVNSGVVVIPELSTKRIVSLSDEALFSLLDTTLIANRRILPRPPPALARNLTVRNLRVTMGNDVFMQSIEANIKLGGSVNVITGSGLTSPGVTQLALEGALQTERGTFNLRMGEGVVQRLFTLEGGEVRFLGDPDFNPDLDIRALYTVRQATSLYGTANDVRIRARLLGTLVQPRIVIESADSLALTESDLFSYLLIGRPSVEIGGLQNYGVDFLLSSLTSGLSARYSGRFFDFLQLTTGTAGTRANQQAAQTFSVFDGAQLGIGKQLTERTFISLTAGLCRFLRPQENPANLADNFGLRLEHRLPAGYGLSLSREPPVEKLVCSQAGSARGFTSGQPQTGFDLFRSWRW